MCGLTEIGIQAIADGCSCGADFPSSCTNGVEWRGRGLCLAPARKKGSMSFFNGALRLFSDTFSAVVGQSVLGMFLCLIPALCAGSFAMALIQQGRKGKL